MFRKGSLQNVIFFWILNRSVFITQHTKKEIIIKMFVMFVIHIMALLLYTLFVQKHNESTVNVTTTMRFIVLRTHSILGLCCTIYLKAYSLLIWIRLIRGLQYQIRLFVKKRKNTKESKPQHKSHACDYAIIIGG